MLSSKIILDRHTDRVEYIDLFRAFGIIFMIMGHIGCGTIIAHFYHAFHMPMFFFVSGYFFLHNDKNELTVMQFILRKARKLLCPYIIFAMIAYFAWIIYYGFSLSPLKSIFLLIRKIFQLQEHYGF